MRTSQFLRLPARQREAYTRAVEAVSLMRHEGLSLKAAAQRTGTSPQTVLRYARSALWYSSARREWRPRQHDNLLRQMSVTTPGGRTEQVLVRGSREAAKVARWQSAVAHFQRTGDEHFLRRLRHKSFVDAAGRRHRLPTDPSQLEGWIEVGAIDIDEVQTP
ncbi:MAG: hypothetical protein QN144_13680 [Armatimonadota bacterium]|nr:hypothetical protein [Armatimonadota bacterium]